MDPQQLFFVQFRAPEDPETVEDHGDFMLGLLLPHGAARMTWPMALAVAKAHGLEADLYGDMRLRVGLVDANGDVWAHRGEKIWPR